MNDYLKDTYQELLQVYAPNLCQKKQQAETHNSLQQAKPSEGSYSTHAAKSAAAPAVEHLNIDD